MTNLLLLNNLIVNCIFCIIFFLEKPWLCYVIIVVTDYFGRTGKSSSEKAPPYRTTDPEADRRTGMSRKLSSSGGPASDQSSDSHAADVTYASQ